MAVGKWPPVDELVPADHLARKVWSVVERIDCGAAEHESPRRRQPPHHPRWLLALWVYASLIGLHHASELAERLKTDAALRWLAGGHTPSAATLKRFRSAQGELFSATNEQVLHLAAEVGVLDVSELAVDSVRIRADASTKVVRTVERSTARLAELSKVDPATLPDAARATHLAKVEKHRAALEACQSAGRTNVVLTAPSAGLMKFPNGGSGPGHRVTATASGRASRFILHVFVDGAAVDYGHLEAAVIGTRDVLERIGHRPKVLQICADPGYHSTSDLAFAAKNRAWTDILIRERAASADGKKPSPYFERTAFDFRPDNTVICPAKKLMIGPTVRKNGDWTWRGDGCKSCPLRAQCTDSKTNRVVTARPDFEKAREAMRTRMARSDAPKVYGGRMAIIEPVFSSWEDAMHFARSSSRKPTTVTAEIVLKVLAHNIDRLLRRSPQGTVWLVVDPAQQEAN